MSREFPASEVCFIIQIMTSLFDEYESRYSIKKDTKKGKLLLSRRSTLYPCCVPTLGEFKRSWP